MNVARSALGRYCTATWVVGFAGWLISCGGIQDSHSPGGGTGSVVIDTNDTGSGPSYGGASNTGGAFVFDTGGSAGLATGGTAGAPLIMDASAPDGAPNGIECTQTNGGVLIRVSQNGSLGADAGSLANSDSIDMAFDGVVSEVTSSTFRVTPCASGAACNGSYSITIDSPGLDLEANLSKGEFAHVHYARKCGQGCANDILVTSLDTWGAVANPYPAPSGLYVAASDGGGSLSDAPFIVEREIIRGCAAYPGKACGADAPGIYVLQLTTENWIARAIMNKGPSQSYLRGAPILIQDQRSYETDQCDDDSNWAYWITGGDRGGS